ncbi:MAG TPA: methyltransferase [Candidatus Acidoferrales bacterium]|nr:methyltransferase [Candidatus Acidoferrales bacterium]
MPYMLLVAAVLFLSSGDPAWAGGWLYLMAEIAGHLATAWTLALGDAGLLRERSAAAAFLDVQAWDRRLAPLAAFAPLAIALLGGLAARYGWTPAFAPGAMVAGLALFAVGLLLGLWAMSANPFYTPVVRIRPAHGHIVVTQGPYRLVRHPGALGTIVEDLAVPLILGSPWAYPAALLVVGLVVLRTTLEDRDLRALLPGYADYAARVRWGLLPGVW